LLPEDMVAGTRVLNLWPGGIVPFVFDGNVDATNRERAREAMALIEIVSAIRFVPLSFPQGNFIRIRSNNVKTNSSDWVGMKGGQQNIAIYSWEFTYVIVHELLHALGFIHEHQRSDRDQYVEVISANIEPGSQSQFTIAPFAFAWGPYDFDSVMHYGRCYCSIDEKDCLDVCPGTSPVMSPNIYPVNPTPVQVTVANRGCSELDVPVTVCMGGSCAPASPSWITNVQPGAQKTGTVFVIPPLSSLDCGGADIVPVTACADLAFDVDRSSDCRTENIAVVDQFWDWDVDIVSAPDDATINPCFMAARTIGWTMRVTNRGNVVAPPTCVNYTIGLFQVCGDWRSNLGVGTRNITSLDPQEATTVSSGAYSIWCSALPRTQYIKAAMCSDGCGGPNNCDDEPIDLDF
jgi:hypothetical protein